MKSRVHLLVIDPTAFAGGSKVATQSMLHQLDSNKVRITVLSADKRSWKSNKLTRILFQEPLWLAKKEQGLAYFMRHLLLAFKVLLLRVKCGRIDVAVGASGPGVDLALYLLKPLLKFKLLQLIHGPVARSRTIARCLKQADEVHYLASSAATLKAVFKHSGQMLCLSDKKFHCFENGLSKQHWPVMCQRQYPVIFWAASLLKWKGLDLLLSALTTMDKTQRPLTQICYIRPTATDLAITQAPVKLENVHWYENPSNLDQIRSSSNIFISSSQQEPFGLSILEAMAAGLCVVIPRDGAYWDKKLVDGVDSIKYTPDDAQELHNTILQLCANMQKVLLIGQRAAVLAEQYGADQQYAQIKQGIESVSHLNDKKSCMGQAYDEV